jgi:diadenylate cyclase
VDPTILAEYAKFFGQICLLTFFFYLILKALRNTPGIFTFASIVCIFVVFSFLSYYAGLNVVGHISRYILQLLPIVCIILFQTEIRRVLRAPDLILSFFSQISAEKKRSSTQFIIDEIVKTVCCLSARPEWREGLRDANGHLSVDPTRLSTKHTGALIAIQGQQGLDEYVERGVRLDCNISSFLLQSIFYPGGPLHDGGVIIRKNRTIAADSNFPPASDTSIGPAHTRHNAAIGLAERTDALVIVVSEESGLVSIAIGHELERQNTPQGLVKALRSYYKLDSLETAAPMQRWYQRVLNWFRPKG